MGGISDELHILYVDKNTTVHTVEIMTITARNTVITLHFIFFAVFYFQKIGCTLISCIFVH